jgi:NAD(P)-dependent dehydrogenase (short-subunit alcohol dehydrogenase family)
VHVVHAFLPLVRKGAVKKVVNLSSGIADLDLIHKVDLAVAAPYAASKAAANIIVAKYAAALKDEGILFLSLSPGFVATESNLEGESEFCLSSGERGANQEQLIQGNHRCWGRSSRCTLRTSSAR